MLMAAYAILAFALLRSNDVVFSFFGWVGLAVVGWFLIHTLINRAFPPDLILSTEGFKVAGIWRRPLIPWIDVDRFWILKVHVNSYLLYALKNQPCRNNIGLWIFRGLPSEADGRLRQTYELDSQHLVNVMNAWKAGHGT